MVYVTGDCHADFDKFSVKNFPEQKNMTRDDFVIVCGDFGLWHDDPKERERLRWLAHRKFTILFVDGNHENFDRLYSNEFPIVDFHGGKAHRIRSNIYHLIRGEVYELCGKKFFAFGGASSHDISDGIIDTDKFVTPNYGASVHEIITSTNPVDMQEAQSLFFKLQQEELKWYRSRKRMYRINHLSWWKEEMPSEEEMKHGIETLEKHNWKVDYVISHCAPQSIASLISFGEYKSDALTDYFEEISQKLDFKLWYFGHYHGDKDVLGNYTLLYHYIERVL